MIGPIPFDLETLCRAIGILGFAIYTTGFFALSTGRINSKEPIYFISVFTASSCVLISLYADFNLSSAMIQVFYSVIALCGILRRKAIPAT